MSQSLDFGGAGNPAWRCQQQFFQSEFQKNILFQNGCFKAVKLVKKFAGLGEGPVFQITKGV